MDAQESRAVREQLDLALDDLVLAAPGSSAPSVAVDASSVLLLDRLVFLVGPRVPVPSPAAGALSAAVAVPAGACSPAVPVRSSSSSSALPRPRWRAPRARARAWRGAAPPPSAPDAPPRAAASRDAAGSPPWRVMIASIRSPLRRRRYRRSKAPTRARAGRRADSLPAQNGPGSTRRATSLWG